MCIKIFVLLTLLFFVKMDAFVPTTQKISLGPECYYLNRTKEGGSWQTGTLAGIYGSYERIKPDAFYWGIIGSYAKGRLDGKSALGRDLASNFTDKEVEIRLGYNINDNNKRYSVFTPFFGLGYLEQINNFLPPSLLLLKFRDVIKYLSFGFLTEVKMSKRFSIGLNVVLKWVFDGKSHTSNDPDQEDNVLIIENEMQYLLELPLTYRLSQHKRVFTISAVPFFQFRHYGGRENYPFDFIDTKFRVYGLRFLCNYWF